MDDQRWMLWALEEARKASHAGEIPVGAVLVRGRRIAGSGYNQVESTGDPFAHAEMVAMRNAIEAGGRWVLQECTLYVTLEPCAMCVGAAILAKIPRLVFGAHEKKTGACESVFSIPNEPTLDHRLVAIGGIEAESCRQILQEFFKKKRGEKSG